MLPFKTTIGQRWWKLLFGGSLVLLGLTSFVLPDSRAEMRYSGGFVQVHRPNDHKAHLPVHRDIVPSTFPDRDFAYPFNSSEGGSASALALSLPWNQPGFENYPEAPAVPWDAALASPTHSALKATPLPQTVAVSEPAAATLIAHLPELARLWVEDTRTRLRGPTHYFRSPPLQPGRKYHYTVRAAWIEDGRWVSQTRTVPVRAGRIQTLYLQPSSAVLAKKKDEASK